jgi:hypothetical protein
MAGCRVPVSKLCGYIKGEELVGEASECKFSRTSVVCVVV